MKKSSISTAVLAALLATVALAGCKKKEDTADNNAQPAATAPAAPAPMTEAAPQPMTAATGVTVSTVTAADKTVTSAALFAPKDDIIVSIRTDGSANNANVAAKLTFQNGQVAGEQNQVVNTTGAETTNIAFKNANGWPAGKYRAEVMVDGKAAGSPQEFEVK